jgi:hypothetical protein
MYAQNNPDRINAILLTFAALMHTILSSSGFLAFPGLKEGGAVKGREKKLIAAFGPSCSSNSCNLHQN